MCIRDRCSSSIIEGLSHSLPMISHTAPSVGQIEQIGNAGKVVEDYEEYSQVMLDLMNDAKYYNECVKNASTQYNNVYNVDSIVNEFISLYEGVVNE